MPVEPPATTWRLLPPPDDHPSDLWAVGGDLEPGTMLAAYRTGVFPMPVAGTIGWFSPAERAVLPILRFHASRRLHRSRRRFDTRVDTAFAEVVEACADPARPNGWIDRPLIDAYLRLHGLGWAHSIEAWDDHGLAGGVFGVAIGGLFAAESMFTARTDASKVALLGLVELLASTGDTDRRVLDVQWTSAHLRSLGAVTVTRSAYRKRLTRTLPLPDPFG
jgi:leucyl/phenylalanyl-tRNA---protein transferase